MPPSIPLDDLCVLSVTGTDAGTFLQGLITIDLTQHGPGDCPLAAFCNQKGRVIATCRVLYPATPSTFWLMIPHSVEESLLAHLKRYILFSDVTLNPLTTHSLCGHFSASPPSQITSSTCFQLSQTPPRQLVITPTSDSPTAPSPHAASAPWHYATLMAGEAWIQADTSTQFTPHMLNYPHLGAVSFNKGCYLGQEIIARTQHLGKQKRSLFRATFHGDTPPQRNTRLQSASHPDVTVVDVCTQSPTTTLLICGDLNADSPSCIDLGSGHHLKDIQPILAPVCLS